MSGSIDFNDYYAQHGKDKTRDLLLRHVESFFGSNQDDDLLNPPPELSPEAYHGILQGICDEATRHSEASPVAIAANTISTFSAMIGRSAHQYIGDGICHARPFQLVIGNTAKARKGTAEEAPRRIFNEVERILEQDLGSYCTRLKRHAGGLSTGEGLGWSIHDDVVNDAGEVIEKGTDDKRLYVVEAEFAGAMAVASRDKNTLSATLRTA